MIYIIHFSEKLSHAQHYVGYCADRGLKKRIKQHRSGEGANTLKVLKEKGIDWEVVATLPGSRGEERRIKNQKKYAAILSGM